MACNAKAVANEFLRLAESDGRKLDAMKLQKLVYFAHGWHLALKGEPLLDEEIQAWDYGPVVTSLYHEFKEFGPDPVDRLARHTVLRGDSIEEEEPRLEDEYAREIVSEVWRKYGEFSGIQLANMTHRRGTPWEMVDRRFQGRIPRGATLPDELIRSGFRRELEAAHAAV